MHKLRILVCALFVWTEHGYGENDYSYDYEDEPAVHDLKKVKGSRLINARAADANEFQFVGALFISSHDKITRPTCTSNLISPDYALR